MEKRKDRELAKRLILKAIENYRQKFILEVDLLSGEERRAILEQIDSIAEEIKEDNKRSLTAERDMYKKKCEELQRRINYVCSIEDCDEEFEL